MSKVLIPVEQFRARIGIGETTEWRMRRDGTAPSWCRIGKRIMYDYDAVERFIESKLAACSPEAA